MSGKCLIARWITEQYLKDLSGAATKVYWALAAQADEAGCCWPGQRELRNLTGLGSFSSISKALAELEQCGLIRRDRQKGLVNLYRLARSPEEAQTYRQTFNRCSENRSAAPENGAPLLRKPERDCYSERSATAPERVAPRYKDISYQEYLIDIHQTPGDRLRRLHRLLIQVGLRGNAPEEIISRYEPADIEQAVKNGLAKRIERQQKFGKEDQFNLPGYVIKTLDRAQTEGKAIGSSRVYRQFQGAILPVWDRLMRSIH